MKPPRSQRAPRLAAAVLAIAFLAPPASAQDLRPTRGTTVRRTQPTRPVLTFVLAKLEVEKFSGEFEQWGTSMVINAPAAETFRWSTSQSSSLGTLQWWVTDKAPTASGLAAGAKVLQSGFAGAQLPPGQRQQFDVYFPPFAPASPPNVPIQYWVFVAPYGPPSQPGAPISTSVVVEYRKPDPPIVLDIPAFQIAGDKLGTCGSGPDTYYRLPFDEDSDWKLTNGNWDDPQYGHGKGNMNGLQAFAFDFYHDYNNDGVGEGGQNVRAARGGVVWAVMDTMSGNMWGGGTPPGYEGVGNFVVIKHMDGTHGVYWHHQKGSASVQVGQTVPRGHVISQVGSTGNSSTPHVHFDVRSGWDLDYPYEDNQSPSVPVRFQDKVHPQGCWLPRVGEIFLSNNS